MQPLTIATRGSRLALWQAEYVRSRLLAARPDLPGIELLVLKTRGDVILDVPLAKVGGKGLFIKEIEEALLDGRADLAVHSMKDLPMELPAGLTLAAIPERGNPEDFFLSMRWESLEALPRGARVGTSSLRRQAQVLAARPDLAVLSLRGNVDTRLRKLAEDEFDAVIMAGAGISRLGLSAPFMRPLPVSSFLPAAGQGALGVETREERDDVRAMLAGLDHAATRITVSAERGFLAGLQGGCQVPIAAHARMTGEASFTLTGLVLDLAGKRAVRREASGRAENARETGLALAREVKAAGGGAILAELLPDYYQEANSAS